MLLFLTKHRSKRKRQDNITTQQVSLHALSDSEKHNWCHCTHCLTVKTTTGVTARTDSEKHNWCHCTHCLTVKNTTGVTARTV
jgi:hypothetical protein